MVGHNPGIHQLAVAVADSGPSGALGRLTSDGFPTCTLAVVQLDVPRWRDVGEARGELLGLFRPPYGS